MQSGSTLGIVSSVGFGVGIAGLVTGAVLLLTGSDAEAPKSAHAWQPVAIAANGAYGGGLSHRW